MRRLWTRVRDGWLYFTVVPAVGMAVLLLAAVALRTTLQVEKSRQQSVIDATWSVASERVDRLDKMIIAQDNVVAASVDVRALETLARRWLPTAARETPTVRAVLVLDASHPSLEVRAFVSRLPGPEDDAFRRLLVHELAPHMELHADHIEQLRHLHRVVAGRNYLVSYWQRLDGRRPHLVVAWHDVSRLVHQVMPALYGELDRNSRMNVIDQHGRILFGSPVRAGGPMVSLRFPTTLYDWRLQVALTSAADLEQKVVRQRLVQLGIVGLAVIIVIAATVAVARAANQGRRLAAMRSDFVANVSHELKTPLASVRMFAELLHSGRAPTEEKQREYLQIIMGESERLTSLIDNVLDFAKLERGKDAYDLSEGDVAEVACRAVEALRYRAERQGVAIAADVEPAPAIIDARALELAIINLIDNALKYARGTDRIEVTARPIPDEDGGGAIVRVLDHGPGIAREEQPRIFDRFVRGQTAQSLHIRGSGIGLALVKHIADTHGGKIAVQSPLPDGPGSAFELRIPPGR